MDISLINRRTAKRIKTLAGRVIVLALCAVVAYNALDYLTGDDIAQSAPPAYMNRLPNGH